MWGGFGGAMSQSPSALKVQLTMLTSGTWSQLALAASLCPSLTCKGHGLSGSRMLLLVALLWSRAPNLPPTSTFPRPFTRNTKP